MRRAWIEQARWWMLSTQRIPGLAGLYRRISLVAMWIAGRRLLQVRGVTAVYSRHTHPRSLAFVPGHSDIDLTVVLDD
ncbi:MAG TPA: hypothetical protein VFU40_02480, partial [Gemmatimonadales bacterium]|nr:hypothetical protein [Gemmatimonadales bacterium]